MIKRIVVIPGDGIGTEITAAAMQVCQKAAEKNGFQLEMKVELAGGAAIDATGVPLPEATIAACQQADAVLLGAVGGPKWDHVEPGLRPEKAILGLRQALGLYANLRPVKVFESLLDHSPLKREIISGVDMVIVRELNGGIYYGKRSEGSGSGKEEAWDTEIYTTREVERIMQMACKIAAERSKRVTSVDKANVLASSRLWRRAAEAVAASHPDILLSHLYVDNCAMQLVLAPSQFDVVVTNNIFGDILSDEAAVITGSIGLLPSASLGDGTGLYEPIHGSAPDIAGKGIANPLGTILSAAMMFRHSLEQPGVASQLEAAVERVLAQGYRTADLYKPGMTKISTEEMGQLVIQNM